MKFQSWGIKALALGAVFFLAIYFVKPIGVSTQFSVISGIIHKTIDPDIITEDDSREYGYASSNAYYDKSEGKLASHIMNPVNYDLIFVLAIPLGAYVMRMILKGGGKKEKIAKADRQKFKLTTYLPAFIGGFFLLYGARMADGCTSGHMMSGMMQGAVSGYLFAAAVFLVAIPTAMIRENRRG